MFRTRVLSVLGVFAALLLLAACAGDDPLAQGDGGAGEEAATEGGDAVATDEAEGGSVVVGSTNFTEQLILAAMYEDLLTEAGVEVETRLNLGEREIVFPALVEGEIDLLPEYIGALSGFLGAESGEEAGLGTEEVYSGLEELLPSELVALEPSDAQDRDALAVTAAFAEENDLETVSDLASVEGPLTLGGPPETETRYNGLPGLSEVYGLEFEFLSLDAGGPLTFGALESGQIDVGRVFSTQGQIEQLDLVVLEDDMDLVPAENLVPVIRADVLTDTIAETLNELSATLTEADLITLNQRVDLDNEDPATVAEDYLTEAGLLEG